MKGQRALLVGRFQPPHRGHVHAVRDAARKYETVLLGIGSAQESHSRDNPFTAGERAQMWTAILADLGLTNVHLFPIPDLHDHPRWVRHVESLVPPFDVVVTNNPLTKRLFKRAGYPVVAGALWRPTTCSGRKIRAAWAAGRGATALLPEPARPILRRIHAVDRVRALYNGGDDHDVD